MNIPGRSAEEQARRSCFSREVGAFRHSGIPIFRFRSSFFLRLRDAAVEAEPSFPGSLEAWMHLLSDSLLLRKAAGRLGEVSPCEPCERSENLEGVLWIGGYVRCFWPADAEKGGFPKCFLTILYHGLDIASFHSPPPQVSSQGFHFNS